MKKFDLYDSEVYEVLKLSTIVEVYKEKYQTGAFKGEIQYFVRKKPQEIN